MMNQMTSPQRATMGTDQSAKDIDVAVEYSVVIVHVAPSDGGLADAWRAVQVNEARHDSTLAS
jgi:hypothetical protein